MHLHLLLPNSSVAALAGHAEHSVKPARACVHGSACSDDGTASSCSAVEASENVLIGQETLSVAPACGQKKPDSHGAQNEDAAGATWPEVHGVHSVPFGEEPPAAHPTHADCSRLGSCPGSHVKHCADPIGA